MVVETRQSRLTGAIDAINTYQDEIGFHAISDDDLKPFRELCENKNAWNPINYKKMATGRLLLEEVYACIRLLDVVRLSTPAVSVVDGYKKMISEYLNEGNQRGLQDLHQILDLQIENDPTLSAADNEMDTIVALQEVLGVKDQVATKSDLANMPPELRKELRKCLEQLVILQKMPSMYYSGEEQLHKQIQSLHSILKNNRDPLNRLRHQNELYAEDIKHASFRDQYSIKKSLTEMRNAAKEQAVDLSPPSPSQSKKPGQSN